MRFPAYDPTEALPGGLRALEASAGTGKTFAVTSTVLRLVVERGVRMDRVLLVTFTRAATAELAERVRDRLAAGATALAAVADGSWDADDHDATLVAVVDGVRDDAAALAAATARVEQALQTVDEATITTIHSFCHQVLSQAAVPAGSDPGVELDTDDDRLVTAVVDDWLVAFTHERDERLVDLLHALGLTRETLLAIGRTVAAEPDPVLVPEVPSTVDVDAVLAAEAAVAAALSTAGQTVAAAERMKEAGEINGNDRYAPRAGRLLNRIDKLRDGFAQGSPSDDVLGGLDPAGDVPGGGSPMHAPIADTPLPQAVGALRSRRIQFETWVRRSLADHVLCELGRRRDQSGTASFADLLRRLAEALDGPGGPAIVAEVGGAYEAVFVDEFQDTDPVQWRILSRLFAGVDVFDVVGDPKQAIYGWRGADLHTYKQARDEAVDRRTMERNFRSDHAYVDACNALLDVEGSLGDLDVPYVAVDTPPRDAPRLVGPTGADAAGLRLVHLRGIGGERGPAITDRVAAEVAEDIVATLTTAGLRIPDDGGDEDADGVRRRPVEARDCAVLVRRHAEAAAVTDALRRRDVAFVVGGGKDVLRSDEAGAMADLLRSLTRPGDERAVRRVLVGPFVGLTGGALVELSEQRRQVLDDRVVAWSRTWRESGVAAAVQRAIREGEAEVVHASHRDGDRAMTNIRHLTELLHHAEQEESLGTNALAAWFDTRRAEALDEDTPPERELRLERDDAAVRVMTVHAAKGLEFPLVWVPFLWNKEGRNDGVAPFVVNDPDAGGTRTVSLHAASSKSLRPLGDRARLRAAYDRAEWEAGLRLAYVALTRAVHRCTLHLVADSYGKGVTKSSAWQLLWRGLGDGAPDSAWDRVVDEDAMVVVLRGLDDHPSIDVTVVDDPCGTTVLGAQDDGVDTEPLEVLMWDRDAPLDVRWGRASFTGLLRRRAAATGRVVDDTADDRDEADRDQAADRSAHGLAPLPLEDCTGPQVPLAPLPRGAEWGTFLHDVLERTAFDVDDVALRTLAGARAEVTGVRADDGHLDLVAEGLLAALATPLGPALDGLRLADLSRRHRLDELEFTLALGGTAAQGVTVGGIAAVLDAHADDSDAPLDAAAAHLRAGGLGLPVHGLLVGAIDLVLRHHGRFWIADYKSNGLGQWVDGDDGRWWCETERHTTPDRVVAAMVEGDYLLQAHLYVVALHRYLQARMGASYDYDTHVGGWAYLFLRGMTGGGVATTDGRPHGVAVGRPTRALVEDLDAVLRGGDA